LAQELERRWRKTYRYKVFLLSSGCGAKLQGPFIYAYPQVAVSYNESSRLKMSTSRIASYGLLSIMAVAQLIPARADESPAQNKVIINDPDDRLSSVPTNWWTYPHQTLQDVTATTSARNARIVDISVEQVSPSYLFTVTYVENAGPYYKPWAWYAGIDAAGLANAISTNKGD